MPVGHRARKGYGAKMNICTLNKIAACGTARFDAAKYTVTEDLSTATGINIETMVNKSKKDNAYTVLDVEGDPDEAALEKILAIDGVIRVRKI